MNLVTHICWQITFPFLLGGVGLGDTTLATRGAAQPIAEVRAGHATLRTCETTCRATEAHRVTTFRAIFAFLATAQL